VNQIGWKDSTYILFLITVYIYRNIYPNTIDRLRRRPKESSSTAKTSRLVFEGQPTKKLSIPLVVDTYNYNMNHVDRADQLRSGNAGLRRIRRGG
jgi:hypothetical protein